MKLESEEKFDLCFGTASAEASWGGEAMQGLG